MGLFITRVETISQNYNYAGGKHLIFLIGY